MEDGSVSLEGDPKFIEHLNEQGVVDKSVEPPKRVFPKDGIIFLHTLPNAINSSYIKAVRVNEADQETKSE